MSLVLRNIKGSPLTFNEMDDNLTYLEGLSGGGGIEGTQYIYVSANGTPTENAQELQDAYDEAKTMSPASDNRIVVILGPGEYQFTSIFTMDTEYIDLVSLTGLRDVTFDLSGITDPFDFIDPSNQVTSPVLLVDTDNVYVRGIKTKVYNSPNFDALFGQGTDYPLPLTISDDLPNLVMENCEGGINSFGSSGQASGTFTNCQGGDFSFGGAQVFGGGAQTSGTFTNCQGGNNSFGGGFGTLSGQLYYCRLTTGTFQTVSGTGVTVLCIDGNNEINTQN